MNKTNKTLAVITCVGSFLVGVTSCTNKLHSDKLLSGEQATRNSVEGVISIVKDELNTCIRTHINFPKPIETSLWRKYWGLKDDIQEKIDQISSEIDKITFECTSKILLKEAENFKQQNAKHH